jgi:hypothetical protein
MAATGLLLAGTHLSATSSTSAELQFAELPVLLQLLSELDHVVSGLTLCLSALLLRRILLSIADGRPFEADNPRRLVRLAVVLLVGGVGGAWAVWWSSTLILGHVGLDPTGTAPIRLPGQLVAVQPLLWALLALAAAVAFRRGRELLDDTDGLV